MALGQTLKCTSQHKPELQAQDPVHLNLLTMTAIIKSTKTVIMATVIILFVAILVALSVSFPKSCFCEVQHYLRAIPLSVFTLLSTYPSLFRRVSCVC